MSTYTLEIASGSLSEEVRVKLGNILVSDQAIKEVLPCFQNGVLFHLAFTADIRPKEMIPLKKRLREQGVGVVLKNRSTIVV